MAKVFFYGLFMDPVLLREKGLNPSSWLMAYVDDYALRIGRRATMVRKPGEQVYGALMNLSERELSALYAEPGVADYVAEKVTAVDMHGNRSEAVTYLLPEGQLSGVNKQYVEALTGVATKLGLPVDYVRQINNI